MCKKIIIEDMTKIVRLFLKSFNAHCALYFFPLTIFNYSTAKIFRRNDAQVLNKILSGLFLTAIFIFLYSYISCILGNTM